MKGVAVFAVVLLVALFAVTDARPSRGNRPDGNSNAVSCRRRCPRPTRRSRVCASIDGLRNNTFPSVCVAERVACRTGRTITVLSEEPCPRPVPQLTGRRGQQEESESESNSEEEGMGGMGEDDSTTPAPTTTTAMPTESPTTLASEPMPVTEPFLPGAGTETAAPGQSTEPGTPAQTGQATASPGLMTGQGTPSPASTASSSTNPTERQCNSLDSCPPSSVVCGTDGQTYDSQCILEVTACITRNDGLTVAYAGFCSL